MPAIETDARAKNPASKYALLRLRAATLSAFILYPAGAALNLDRPDNASRAPAGYQLELEGLLQYGASPRATLFMVAAGRGHAFLEGRGFVTPEDIKAIVADVLRHRLILSFEAEAESVTAEEVRWRAGDEIGGTGSQENARLTLLNGGPTGQFISTVFVTNGEWSYPGGAPALTGGTLYVWSDFGFTGTIRTTN